MINKGLFSILVITLFIFNSCKDDDGYPGPSTDFGIAEYYKPFLFSKSDTIFLSKTLKYNFNEYAVQEGSSIKIKLVDSDQNNLSDPNIRCYINGELVKNNEFEINSEGAGNGAIKIGLQLLPDYPKGYTSGFLSISSHSLNVVNNTDLESSSEKRIFK